MKPQDKVTQLRGIGPKKAEALIRLGIETLEDLVFSCPGIMKTADTWSVYVISSRTGSQW